MRGDNKAASGAILSAIESLKTIASNLQDGHLVGPLEFEVLPEESDPHEVVVMRVRVDTSGIKIKDAGDGTRWDISWAELRSLCEKDDLSRELDKQIEDAREELRLMLDDMRTWKRRREQVRKAVRGSGQLKVVSDGATE